VPAPIVGVYANILMSSVAVPAATDGRSDGVKYAFHYGRTGGDEPILRYDNHHGVHERHEGGAVEEIDFPGYERLLRRFVRELPADHAPDTDLDP